MNLWLRLLWLIVTFRFRPKLTPPFDVSNLTFRVWPHDLDLSAHMNNGRYWTLMDLGRTDMILRSGLWRAVLAHRWTPVVSAGEIRFRRELRPFARFRLRTAIASWTETHLVIEHRFLDEGDAVAAIALVRAALYDRAARRFVPIRELMAEVGVVAESPPPAPEVEAFLAAEDALRAVTAEARDPQLPA
ncbi:thioesterase family protein [Methylopila turkensis]|uniref:Thioesterase n=1 Tax=Methylopila turkensis TaxID=1437816 RepID=A0A9W6JSN7_9HYPH|nr:thioesterase family protein [Methylopila turkensis]GLK81079.1 thioesterase [Methylopila turkensis]